MSSPPTDLILFGATGDLALRKLFPALYEGAEDPAGPLANVQIMGAARHDLDDAGFRAWLDERVPDFLGPGYNRQRWLGVLARTRYTAIHAMDSASYHTLAARLGEQATRATRPLVHYLATAPQLFIPICEGLAQAGLAGPSSRIVLEKPLGRDLKSSREINDAVGQVFGESQIFRIDHYLGKETVQNLLALRFGNTLFEPLWNRTGIEHVQITIAEQVGVEQRGEFYDRTGALRDMVQNHLLQLLCIVAMEPPASADADALRDAKLQVLRALKPLTEHELQTRTVRGQYAAGAIQGQPVPGYLAEPDVAPDSRTETYVALRAEIDNWRWAGVPFYLRTGKRMPTRLAEVVIQYRPVPHSVFGGRGMPLSNRLVLNLQPDDGLTLVLNNKVPGSGQTLQERALNLSLLDDPGARRQEAYERLLGDAVEGRLNLFMRRDEQEAAWRWVEPVLRHWESAPDAPRPYT
ncbi:MAG: glucose-6-phosphate dehydrogenase, partial [Burkholderiaceae bacterium]